MREIGKLYGLSYKQVCNFFTKYNANQRKIEAGIVLRAKGRTPEDYKITEDMKNNPTAEWVARTVVHEITHYRYEVGNSQ